MDFIKDYELSPDDDFYALLGCDELSSADQIVVGWYFACLNVMSLYDPMFYPVNSLRTVIIISLQKFFHFRISCAGVGLSPR